MKTPKATVTGTSSDTPPDWSRRADSVAVMSALMKANRIAVRRADMR
jgi:hypothetical protein